MTFGGSAGRVPREKLNATECTQPAMLAAGVAVWRVWLGQGGARPAVMAGHSLGRVLGPGVRGRRRLPGRGRAGCGPRPVHAGSGAERRGSGSGGARAWRRRGRSGVPRRRAGRGRVPRELQRAGAGGARRPRGSGGAGSRATPARPARAARSCFRSASRCIHPSWSQPRNGSGHDSMKVDFTTPATAGGGEHRGGTARRSGLDTRPPRPPAPFAGAVDRDRLPARGVGHRRGFLEPGPGRVLAGLNRRVDRRMKACAVFDPASLDAALEELGGG